MDERVIVICPKHFDPLKSTNISSKCNVCYEDHHDNKQGYKCGRCAFYVNEECNNVNIPSHHKHLLQLKWVLRWEDRTCCLCETALVSLLAYQCLPCSFFVCVPCARKPLVIAQTKAHEHELRQIPMKLFFTCDACGLGNTQYPCICLQCCFIIHRTCIVLPRVIYINRHDHRISHVSSLSPGKWICGVCREPVNQECGAYSCLVCLFVAHSKCATNVNIWDGRELEGVLEEEDEKEESKPFQVIDQNLIKHFIHEHNLTVSESSLRVGEDALTHKEDKHCYACTLLLDSELCYKCTQCDFSLHDECASLPRRKRHVVSSRKFCLCATAIKGYEDFENYFICYACQRYSTGFLYRTSDAFIDVRCASISDTLKHGSHPHWLFTYYDVQVWCDGCGLVCQFHLRCNGIDDCGGFILCFRCATIPTLVRHKYDDHPLSLCYGERNMNSTYCCGICEKEIDSESWFYRCNDCGSTLHIECVFNNLIHSRPGYSLRVDRGGIFDLLPTLSTYLL
ncbi:hypothetical protein EUTSA_v10028079mg [Eutrema salsugineum]|uniref:DC1 domain-containing protein n=1 Tax=Eutrema salsugineum TaxID=72664 RepID=V4L950_EUTSA|nr:hypothetical protein EUTSA_v10028079mg [Eutrema salsugineum]